LANQTKPSQPRRQADNNADNKQTKTEQGIGQKTIILCCLPPFFYAIVSRKMKIGEGGGGGRKEDGIDWERGCMNWI
jgi:hypothetical protein